MSPPQSPHDWFPYDLASPVDAYAQGLWKTVTSYPLSSEFVGMAGYAPTSIHDLINEKIESNGSSVGDVPAPSHPLSRECAMAGGPGKPSEVVEPQQAHTHP